MYSTHMLLQSNYFISVLKENIQALLKVSNQDLSEERLILTSHLLRTFDTAFCCTFGKVNVQVLQKFELIPFIEIQYPHL